MRGSEEIKIGEMSSSSASEIGGTSSWKNQKSNDRYYDGATTHNNKRSKSKTANLSLSNNLLLLGHRKSFNVDQKVTEVDESLEIASPQHLQKKTKQHNNNNNKHEVL